MSYHCSKDCWVNVASDSPWLSSTGDEGGRRSRYQGIREAVQGQADTKSNACKVSGEFEVAFACTALESNLSNASANAMLDMLGACKLTASRLEHIPKYEAILERIQRPGYYLCEHSVEAIKLVCRDLLPLLCVKSVPPHRRTSLLYHIRHFTMMIRARRVFNLSLTMQM